MLGWGCSLQAAERAVAESNREIGGYPVAAINIPTDRLTHYGLRQVTPQSECKANSISCGYSGHRSGILS